MTALLFVSLLWGLEQPAPTQSPSVAMVCNWSGAATWSDGKTSRPVKSYDRLRTGETVTAGPGGSVTIYFMHDGHKEILHSRASIVVTPKNGTASGEVDVVKSKLNVENRDSLRDQIGAGKIGGTVLRSNRLRESAPIIAPINEAVLVTDTPTLQWPPVKDAAKYRVTLETAGGRTPLWTREVVATKLAYPKDAKPLMRAMKYRWFVTAILENEDEKPHLRDRVFTVGTEGMANQAATWKELAASTDPADRMLAAVGYERLGMLDELYPLYAKITEQVTNDAQLFVIYSSYAAKAGMAQEANAALEKAKKLGWHGDP